MPDDKKTAKSIKKTTNPALEKVRPLGTTEHHGRQAGHVYYAEAIKALTLINGGAAIASLAFFGQLAQNRAVTTTMIQNVGWSIAIFATGTMLPVLAAIFLAYHQVRASKFLRNSARMLIFVAIALFFVGLWYGWQAVADLGFSNVEVRRAQ